MEVQLVEPSPSLIAIVGAEFALAPIDTDEHQDHAWLFGDTAHVIERIDASIRYRLDAGGVAFIIVNEAGDAIGFTTATITGASAETFTAVVRRAQRQRVATQSRRLLLARLASLGVVEAHSYSRKGSPSGRISRQLGYMLIDTITRAHPRTGDLVELEHWTRPLP